ncbi:hypothetical protein [Actinoplanes utahensis]|uniref:hypothetical protein n=1 Tax=Actinoplanes utahensis TaxID=1869 RepID=UPI001269F1B0|nr:hypothetical protein [Actinoplanes utahensis]GIF34879.1 hypothetical protein Aut01nite_78650 [Actinoplanes utahensis]
MPGLVGKVTGANEIGVLGESELGEGVRGLGRSNDHAAVAGINSTSGPGVFGESASGHGIRGLGRSNNSTGVVGTNSAGGTGVFGESESGKGIHGLGRSNDHAGVVGTNSAGGPGVYGKSVSGPAGFFDGDVRVAQDLIVDGDIQLVGADVAEQFEIQTSPDEIAESLQPGSVVVLDEHGRIGICGEPYNNRVAGIISGAGDRVPALVLDRTHDTTRKRRPIAVVGKAWCLADATNDPIAVGDLLTTSTRPGHAMRAADRLASIGTVVGKALTALPSGTGHVLVLVGLR